MRVLNDVHAAAVEALAWNRWEWSQMGVVIVGQSDDLVAAVVKAGLREMDALKAIGWIVVQGNGGGIEPGSRTTVAKLRRLAGEVGVAWSPGSERPFTARRLDFATGREVVTAVGNT